MKSPLARRFAFIICLGLVSPLNTWAQSSFIFDEIEPKPEVVAPPEVRQPIYPPRQTTSSAPAPRVVTPTPPSAPPVVGEIVRPTPTPTPPAEPRRETASKAPTPSRPTFPQCSQGQSTAFADEANQMFEQILNVRGAFNQDLSNDSEGVYFRLGRTQTRPPVITVYIHSSAYKGNASATLCQKDDSTLEVSLRVFRTRYPLDVTGVDRTRVRLRSNTLNGLFRLGPLRERPADPFGFGAR